jgi:hypothetical protein
LITVYLAGITSAKTTLQLLCCGPVSGNGYRQLIDDMIKKWRGTADELVCKAPKAALPILLNIATGVSEKAGTSLHHVMALDEYAKESD